MMSYTLPQTIPTSAALRGMSPPGVDGFLVQTGGYGAASDAGAGLFSWVAGATNPDDDWLWTCPTGYNGTGRFRRVGSNKLSVLDFGADRSGNVDTTQAIYNTFVKAAIAHKGVYFPSGKYLIGSAGTAAWLNWVVYSGCVISGDGMGDTVIKLADNGDSYFRLIGHSDSVQGVTIRDLTIDQNATNNQSQKILELDPTGTNFILVYLSPASNAVVRDCEFRDVYGVNTIVIGGGSGNVVKGNVISSNPINAGRYYDNSAIYVDSANFQVVNNTVTGNATGKVISEFQSDPYPPVSVSGIEVHGGPAMVSGNNVQGFVHAANVVNGTYVDDSIGCGITVTHNNFYLCNNGVVLFANPGTTFRGAHITNNHMLLDLRTITWTNVLGVGFTPQAGCGFEDFSITDNTISFLAPPATSLRADAVAGIGFPFVGEATFNLIRIRNNTILRAPNMGIALRGTSWSNSEIVSNTIIDAGVGNCATADHRSALYADNAPWSQVDIHDNRIKYTGASAGRCAHSAYLQPASGSVRNSFTRNSVVSGFSIDQSINEDITQS